MKMRRAIEVFIEVFAVNIYGLYEGLLFSALYKDVSLFWN
jgi:hypothetical protein